MRKLILLMFMVLCALTASSDHNSEQQKQLSKIRKTVKNNEQVISPSLDGFLSQASGVFDLTQPLADLKKYPGFVREIYLNFDFSNLTISAKTAKLRLFCDSFDKFSEPNIALYAFEGYRTNGLTWATRPVFPAPTATISVNSIEHTKTWMEWDLKSFLPTILQSQNKQATFVLAVTSATAGSDVLMKFNMSENATNKPNILLNDEENSSGGPDSIIKLPGIFTNDMVLQRDKPIKVWGEVSANEPVTIQFDGIDYQTQCNSSGKFSINLPSKSVSPNSYSLSVSSKGLTRTFTNVVMGDVFLCGGQSNMAMFVSSTKPEQIENALADSNYPDLRFFEVAKIVSGGVLINQSDKPWKSAIPERVPSWSAVAFFLGRDLHKHLNIPIGLINVSHGGAPSDAFISPEAYASNPLLNAAKRPDGTGIYQYYTTPSSLYNSMVSKVAGYPVKGVFWYQAEANAGYWQNYKTIFKGLIEDWRTKWNEPALPWIFVQLPAFETSTNWAETRDIQLQVWKEDPNTGMAVTMDCGEANNIHPTDKYTVAKRLLPLVRNVVYGEQIISKSPIYKSHEVVGSELFVIFDNVNGGLMAVKEISEFEIAAADKVFKTATASILPDNSIKLSNASISNPVYVRYAFRNNSTISIFTTDELPLPLSPFKTDYPEPVGSTNEISFEKINNAYASSTFSGRLPLYAINGAGLAGDEHEANVTSKAWHSDDKPFPHYFKIELKTPQDVAAMRIWNLNWSAAYLNRGVRELEIYVSESPSAIQDTPFTNSVWKKVMNYSMNQASGENNYEGEMFNFPTVQKDMKWVGINILNSYNSANGYTGISEIKLFSPEVASGYLNNLKKQSIAVFSQNNKLHIKSLITGSFSFSLYSIHGLKVFSDNINSSLYTLPTEFLSKGCYLLSIYNETMKQHFKILI
jgi:sialate O-acetylesterase